jgi:hypothetical protein
MLQNFLKLVQMFWLLGMPFSPVKILKERLSY